jgi:hypothetical protein
METVTQLRERAEHLRNTAGRLPPGEQATSVTMLAIAHELAAYNRIKLLCRTTSHDGNRELAEALGVEDE